MKTCLAMFAQAWDPPAATASVASRTTRSGFCLPPRFTLDLVKPFLQSGAIVPKIDRNGFGVGFENLGAFLIASAFDHFIDKQPMRRCQVCTRWFPIRRSTRVIVRSPALPRTQGICKNGKHQEASREVAGAWHFTIDGKRKQGTRLFDTKAEAKRYAALMAEQVERRGLSILTSSRCALTCITGSTITPSAAA